MNQRDAKSKATLGVSQEKIYAEQRKVKTLQKNIAIDENALVKKESEMAKVSLIE